MSKCEFDNLFADYLAGELDAGERAKIDAHVIDCRRCQTELQQYENLTTLLQAFDRPRPSANLLQAYESELRDRYAPRRRLSRIYTVAAGMLEGKKLFSHRAVQFAGIACVLLIGLLLGKLIFEPAREKPVVAVPEVRFTLPQEEMKLVHNFLVSSEMLLLEIVNTEPDESFQSEDFLLDKEMAQKLLMQTFIVHEKALRLHDERISGFLTGLEILLYEVANAEEEQRVDLLRELKPLIIDQRLLSLSRELRDDYAAGAGRRPRI